MGVEVACFEPIVILSDSKSAINISTNPIGVVSKYSKHILQKVHWFREHIKEGTLRILHIKGTENVADIMTKCLGRPTFLGLREKLLRGDFRTLRRLPHTMCAMHYLHDLPEANGDDTQIHMQDIDSICNCHDTGYFCIPSSQVSVLLHTSTSHS